VYEWEEDDGEEQLHVYYGLELLEVVSADRNAASFKMLVGRLYNAGLSRRVLQETFRVDLKTIQADVHWPWDPVDRIPSRNADRITQRE
jgi:hypothetical protein